MDTFDKPKQMPKHLFLTVFRFINSELDSESHYIMKWDPDFHQDDKMNIFEKPKQMFSHLFRFFDFNKILFIYFKK